MKNNTNKNNRVVGVLGGMGPGASVYLYKLLIEQSIKEYGARNNDDFPEIILHSVPVPDFISNNLKREEALNMLQERVKTLNKMQISCIGIACNTAHIFLKELQGVSEAPFVSMIDEVAAVIVEGKMQRVGILGTPSTLRSHLYGEILSAQSITSISPPQFLYNRLEKIIRKVISGTITKKDRADLVKIADFLYEQGAEGIILGCTELPLVFPANYKLPVYNSVEILAEALLRRYYK